MSELVNPRDSGSLSFILLQLLPPPTLLSFGTTDDTGSPRSDRALPPSESPREMSRVRVRSSQNLLVGPTGPSGLRTRVQKDPLGPYKLDSPWKCQ